MTNEELPENIMEYNIKEIKSILVKKDTSDFLWGLSGLFTKMMKSLSFIPPEYQAGTDIIDYLKENFGSTAAQRRQLEFLMRLFKRLQELENSLDSEFIKKDEFEIYIQRFLDNIKYEQYKEKILAFQNAMVNIATKKFSNNLEIEYFINNLLNFSDLHFKILVFFYNPLNYFKEKGINIEEYRNQTGGENRVIEQVFEDINSQLLELASKELHDKGFTTMKFPFSGGLSTQSAYDRLTQDYLTPLGRRFISFVKDEQI